MGLIRLLIFGIFFYLIYFLLRNLLFRPFRQGYAGERGNPYKKQKEGDVTITYNPQKGSGHGKQVGEYVDYEEVEER